MYRPERSVGFLLENAGPVIRYRLKKDILHDITSEEEELMLDEIYQLPHMKLVLSYSKENGYIGSGMHSWDNWRGKVLHETPLQDGECAARLLSYYRIPKDHKIITDFISALRDEDTLKKEFLYIPPEIPRFEKRFVGINSGNCLMALIYTMQAILGCGDETAECRNFQMTSLKGFERILEISSLDDITAFNENSKSKYNCPYIEPDEYFPNVYTLETLAHTQSWRTEKNIAILADSLNRINEIMKPDNELAIRINGKLIGPMFALARPIIPFKSDYLNTIVYRRTLTHAAMCGVGDRVHFIEQSMENINDAFDDKGILRTAFELPENRKYSPKNIKYPTAYTDVRLEHDYKKKTALDCDLTFWALEFMYYTNGCKL